MVRSKLSWGLFLLSPIILFSCKRSLKNDNVAQIYFGAHDVAVLCDDPSSTTWQYLRVYNQSLSNKEFEYSTEGNKLATIDSVFGHKVYVSMIRWDYFLSSNRTRDEYIPLYHGKFDLYIRYLHLGGSANEKAKNARFLGRSGNIILLQFDSSSVVDRISLKNVYFTNGTPFIRTISQSTLEWTPILFKDSSNFKEFNKSLLLE